MSFDGVERSLQTWYDRSHGSIREAIEQACENVKLLPLPPCGSTKDRPHLHHPRAAGWTYCASCGANIFVRKEVRT